MICYLGLGSNLGNRQKFIEDAIFELSSNLKIEILQKSEIIETKPFGKINQPNFINCVVKIDTIFSASNLLETCLNIENKLKRIRIEKWGPRTIDIDLLFYGNEIIESQNLTIPHPELHKRLFVLNSLNEICPEFVHPKLNKTIKELTNEKINELEKI